MDTLSNFLERYSLRTSVFYSGNLCGQSHFASSMDIGHIHVIESGNVELLIPGKKPLKIHEASVIFFPSSTEHSLKTPNYESVNLVCSTIDLGFQEGNQIFKGMPDFFVISLLDFPELKNTMALLFSEGVKNQLGSTKSINLLLEYFVILLLRHVIQHELITQGVLAALGNKEIGSLMLKLHQSPEENWTIEKMGREAGMSRTKFANFFKHHLGDTPLDYLTNWRLTLAKKLITQGIPLKLLPEKVGYSSNIAFTRAFQKKFNVTPSKYKSSLNI